MLFQQLLKFRMFLVDSASGLLGGNQAKKANCFKVSVLGSHTGPESAKPGPQVLWQVQFWDVSNMKLGRFFSSGTGLAFETDPRKKVVRGFRLERWW